MKNKITSYQIQDLLQSILVVLIELKLLSVQNDNQTNFQDNFKKLMYPGTALSQPLAENSNRRI